MGYANSTLTKPFTTTVDLVKNALGLTLARPFTATQIFASDKINMWSKRKPVKSSAVVGPIDMAAAAYGFTVTKATTVAEIITQGRAFVDNKRTVGGISYAPPTTGPRRWSDWDGYSRDITTKPWSFTISAYNGNVSVFFDPVLVGGGATGDIIQLTELGDAIGVALSDKPVSSVGVACCPASAPATQGVIQLSPAGGEISITSGGVTQFALDAGEWDVVLFFGRIQFGTPYVVCGYSRVTIATVKQQIFINLEGEYYSRNQYRVRIRAVDAQTLTDINVPTYIAVDVLEQPDNGGIVFANFEIEQGSSLSDWYTYFAATGRVTIGNVNVTEYGDYEFMIGQSSYRW